MQEGDLYLMGQSPAYLLAKCWCVVLVGKNVRIKQHG
jgi:hypothetical protein